MTILHDGLPVLEAQFVSIRDFIGSKCKRKRTGVIMWSLELVLVVRRVLAAMVWTVWKSTYAGLWVQPYSSRVSRVWVPWPDAWWLLRQQNDRLDAVASAGRNSCWSVQYPRVNRWKTDIIFMSLNTTLDHNPAGTYQRTLANSDCEPGCPVWYWLSVSCPTVRRLKSPKGK